MHRALLSLAIAATTALGLLGSMPAPVSAAGDYTETAATTYRLDPAKGVIHVTVTIKFTNQSPPSRDPYTCFDYYYDYWLGYVPYLSTCYTTTSYYYSSTTAVIENAATGVKATSGGTSLKVSSGSKGETYHVVKIAFPKLYYGKTRTIALTYTIKGGAPRSASSIRALRAYATFCAVANGSDSATVTVRVPATFQFETWGDDMTDTVKGSERVFTSGAISDPSEYYTCFDGTNPSGYKTESLRAPDGRTVLLQSWPEDDAWATGVRAEVLGGMPELAKIVGRNMAGTAPLTVAEASTGAEYAGFYDEKTNTITVGEDFTQESLVEHELAHAYFNGTLFKDTWLSEGYAEWAGRDAANDQPACTEPPASDITLATWTYINPRSTLEERLAVDAQYDAACWVVTKVAAATTGAGMTAALAVLFDARDPYAVDPSAKREKVVATWKEWLDAIDEVALADSAASASLASDLLLEFGAADDNGLLESRTDARSAYHTLLGSVGDWVVPVAVRAPMAAWEFRVAQDAIAAAPEAYELTGQTDETLDGIDARHGPAADAWAAAQTAKDLKAAADLARAQLDAAKDVVAAQAEAARPLDLVEQVGLLGATIPGLDPAVAAVRAADADAAAQVTASVRATIGGLREIGQGRLTTAAIITGVVVLLLIVLTVLLVRRRRGRRRAALAAAGAMASASWTAPAPWPEVSAVAGVAEVPETPAAQAPTLAWPAGEARNRLGFARWLVSPDHPLTARVAVNQQWQMLFGVGLVKTTEDFGSQGELPSHPELLDWLATEFLRTNWDVKRSLKTMVMSATYRQSSRVSPALLARDPENRLLARGPRVRMEAGMIRDQALAVSGLLVGEIGGPSVKPYQPPGLWKELSGTDYEPDQGDKLWRRSLYTFWKRTSPPPTMMTFDAAGREACSVRPVRTSTPLQALALLNDVTFVEAARVLAQRVMREGGPSPEARLRLAFRLVLARAPSDAELKVLRRNLDSQLAHFQTEPSAAQELVRAGEAPRDAGLAVGELAAYSTVAGLILNLDEAITKP